MLSMRSARAQHALSTRSAHAQHTLSTPSARAQHRLAQYRLSTDSALSHHSVCLLTIHLFNPSTKFKTALTSDVGLKAFSVLFILVLQHGYENSYLPTCEIRTSLHKHFVFSYTALLLLLHSATQLHCTLVNKMFKL